MIELPMYARVVRTLPVGEHPYVSMLPGIENSPAARRIESPAVSLASLLKTARIRIQPGDGYVWVDDETPAIVMIESYYREGNPCDLYLDLLHELTHLRQLASGEDIWDESFHYVDRPTEIEGYAVAIEEARRLGMTESAILEHLSNPWMSRHEVLRLRRNVERLLRNGCDQGSNSGNPGLSQ